MAAAFGVPFRAEFFVAKDRAEAQLDEDFGERIAVVYDCFVFDSGLVAKVFGVLVGDAFVCEQTGVSVQAEAQQLALGAQGAIRCVVEGVGFEAAIRAQPEL